MIPTLWTQPELALWLTRRPSGDYVLTRLRPVIARRLGSDEDDVYESEGEPIGVRHLCPSGIAAAGWVLPPCEPTRVFFTLAAIPRRRTTMKVSIDLTGPNGKMWEMEMKYMSLPPEYVSEIAAVAQSYAVYIKNLPGQAGSAEPSYGVTFSYEAEGDELKGVAEPLLSVFKPKDKFRAVRLLYSQAIEVQDAGIALLTQLQAGAHREIKSGQRT